MRTQTVAIAAATISAALVLAGCGASDTVAAPPAPATAAAPAASGEHNAADIAFVQGMIPHHSQAVQMARLAPDRAAGAPLAALAVRIEQAQGPEITQMREFLTAWGAPETSGTTGMHDMPGMSGTTGMMSEQQLQQLEQARGTAFDRMFLQMMIQHHQGAVAMARTEIATGANPQAKTLAQRIIDAQQAEITEMNQLLAA